MFFRSAAMVVLVCALGAECAWGAEAARAVVAGDFDGDGVKDLAAATGGGVVVRKGLGGGTYEAARVVWSAGEATALAAADVAGDGSPELVVGVAGGVLVLQGGETGAWVEASRVDLEEAPAALWVGDLNGDGRKDVVAAGRRLTVALGLEGGGFGKSEGVGLAGTARGVTAADFDGDGMFEVVVAAEGLRVFRATEGGRWEEKGRIEMGGAVAEVGVYRDSGGSGPHVVARVAGSEQVWLAASEPGLKWRAAVALEGIEMESGRRALREWNEEGLGALEQRSGPTSLTVTKTHSGVWYRGMKGGKFTIVVNGPAGAVELTDYVPAGLTVVQAGGAGWECTIEAVPQMCWGYMAPDANGDRPPLTLEVDVAANAPLEMVNTVVVTGGGQAQDPIVLAGAPVADLTVTKTHADPFTPGQVGAQYQIVVWNVGTGAASGTVAVTDTLPAGMTATAMSGPGWTCNVGQLTCVRNDGLAAPAVNGTSAYPPITLVVTVGVSTPSSTVNVATVSGGGDTYLGNNRAEDPTGVARPDLTVWKFHQGNFQRGQVGAQYSVWVTNNGALGVTGTTTLVEQPPAGLTVTGMAGSGWTCVLGSLTCTNTTPIGSGSMYSPLTVTVNVAVDAPPLVTNTVVVSNAGDTATGDNTATDPTVIETLGVDLTIAKTHAGNFTAGQTGTYSLTVTNLTAYPVTGTVTVVETPPVGMTVTGMSGAGWSCVVGTLTCTATGGVPGAPIVVTVSVAANASGTLVNTATVSGGGDVYGGNNTAQDPTVVVAPASGVDLRIVKTHVGNFRQGQLGATYTIGVTNVGTSEPTGPITVTEQAPAGMTVTMMSNGFGSCNLNSCTMTPATYTAPIIVTVNVALDAPAQLTNVATVSTTGDTNTSNNTASDVTVIEPGVVDLTLAKTHTGNFARGGTGTYTLVVSNAGNTPSSGTITVTEVPPVGMTVTALDGGTNWACTLATLSCTNIQNFIIPAGSAAQPITVTVSVASNAAPDVVNTATVSGGGDSVPGNNTANDPTHTTGPDLRIIKTHVGNFRQGQRGATYTIGVVNVGESEPTGPITVTEQAPAGMTVTMMSSMLWSCGASGCTASPATYTAPIIVTVNVALDAPAQLTNVATVSTTGDTNTSNNTASDVTVIEPGVVDLVLTKTHTGNFARGGTGSYTLVVSNAGNTPSSGTITVTEVPPAGMTVTALDGGTSWACTLATLSCTNIQNFIIPAGSAAQPITVTVSVASNAAPDVVNTATVSGGGDSVPGNNTANDPTHTTGPDLRIIKTHVGNFRQGQRGATYTIGVVNVGESEPTGPITVTEQAPAGMTVTMMSSMLWSCGASGCTASPATYTAPITVTVNVALDAPAQLTNVATVSTAGDTNTANNTASDVTVIEPGVVDLVLAKTHTGNFARGGTGTYTLVVSNAGNTPSSGTITVTEVPPAGLTVTAMDGGQNWACTLATLSCTNIQNFIIPAGSAAQPITVMVSVASNAAPDVVNTATVSGGGDSVPGNNTANDPTHTTGPDLRIVKTHVGNFRQGQRGATYTIGVVNVGESEPTGPITVTEQAPAGMTVTMMSSMLWSCNLNTCTASPQTYTAPITVTVNVALDAPAQLTNVATVSTAGDTNTANNTASDVTVIEAGVVDLVMTKTHTGNFARGGTGTYTLVVSNAGNTPSSGTITVTEVPPAGLTVTAMDGGQNWACTLATLSCTNIQNFIIPAGSAAQPITVTVSVASTAAASVTNTAVVAGGGDSVAGNNAAADPTTIVGPDYGVVKSHAGNFRQGQIGASYQIQVSNVGNGPLVAPVAVQEQIPAGLTLTSMTGAGWNCSVALARCVNSAAVLGGPITVTVNVAANAAALVTNVATVSSADDFNSANNRAEDPTVIEALAPDLRVNKTHTGTFTQGQTGAAYTISVSNNGTGPTSGVVTVADVLPASGLTVTAMSGAGWACSVATLSCTRSDVLAAGGSYPPVTVTVTVAANAPASVVNTATVAGGGDTNAANNSSADVTVIAATSLNVTLTQSAVTLNRATGRYEQTVSIRNNGAALPASAVALDGLTAGVTLFNASGVTSATVPAGSPYREAGPIATGATATVKLEFTRPAGVAISYTPRVLGGGPR